MIRSQQKKTEKKIKMRYNDNQEWDPQEPGEEIVSLWKDGLTDLNSDKSVR